MKDCVVDLINKELKKLNSYKEDSVNEILKLETELKQRERHLVYLNSSIDDLQEAIKDQWVKQTTDTFALKFVTTF